MVKHDEILAALTARTTWEDRQSVWYKMRHDGLRRKNKPWANAADMHFPLADSIIEKLKPQFTAQIFATDTVASFVALKQDFSNYQAAAGQWFDYKLKQESNFEEELEIAPDIALQGGKAIVKVYWDATAKRFTFEAINPIDIIVPPWTGRIERTDWIVHIQRYSVAAYKRLKGFKNDDDTVKRIAGSGDKNDGSRTQYDTAKYQREGITRAKNDEEIVIWEVYSRDDNGKWIINTYSPTVPDLPLRAEFGLPYNKGVFSADLPPPPFGEVDIEVKDRGFFSARGVCERVASFEASLCKDWNTIKDYQTLTCSPVFYAKQGVPQGQNLRMIPGQILPFELAAVTFPQIPVDLPMQMQGTRTTAEQLMAVPDVGTGRTVDPSKNKTAAETNLIASIMGQNTDSRSRVFRRHLGTILNLAWGIAVQYCTESLSYYFNDELLQLDNNALQGSYRIQPNGSGDNLNRGLVLQRSVSRFQMFKGDPDIKQIELKRSVLEADDPRLVKTLLLDQGTQTAEQQEDQAQEISIMLLGFPPVVKPTDDDLAHITSMAGFVQRRMQMREPLSPETLNLLAQHTEQHLAGMKKKTPQVWAQRGQQFQHFVAQLKQQAQAAAAPQPGGNVVPMPGAQQQPQLMGAGQ